MDPDIVQPVNRRPNWSFIALHYSLLGWALFESWLLLMGGGILLHIIAAIPGLTLTIRSALHRPIDSHSSLEDKKHQAIQFRWTKSSCAVLYVFGAILGFMVLNGSLTLLGLTVATLTLAPWARLPFSRNNLAISCLITTSGFASLIAIGHRSVDIMFLPFAAWAFWGFASCALLFRAEQLSRSKHESKVTTDTVKTPTSPIQSAG